MSSDLYRLVYCSRNLIRGSEAEIEAEIQQILASSRTNNTRAGVTGALLYTTGMFAQVLEGPLESVEQIFEVIQGDARHSEVVVVQSGAATERDFPNWSMAFAGAPRAETVAGAVAAFDAAYAQAVGAGEQMLGVLKELVVQEDDWILLERAS